VIVAVVAHPKASNRRVVWDGEALQVWVVEPASEGRANRAVVEAVAQALGLRPSAVELVRGARGRRKQVKAAGLEPAVLERLRIGGDGTALS
jgi:uncharacterized protein